MTDPTREAFDSDVDLMRDVYMLPSQRGAYERILQAALSARAQGEALTLHDRVEFALRDAGLSESEAARITAIAATPAAPKQQAVDKETLVAFERVFWKAVELSGSRNFDHDVCKEVRDFRSLLAALPGKTEVDRG